VRRSNPAPLYIVQPIQLPVLFWVGVTFRYARLVLFAMLGEQKWGAAFAAPRGQRGGLNEVDLIMPNYYSFCCVVNHKKTTLMKLSNYT